MKHTLSNITVNILRSKNRISTYANITYAQRKHYITIYRKGNFIDVEIEGNTIMWNKEAKSGSDQSCLLPFIAL